MSENIENMDMDLSPTIITLEDEEGVEREFEHIDTMELDGVTYVALIPSISEDNLADADGELVVLRVTIEGDEEILASIEDESEFEKVVAAFEERLEDEFEFED